LVWEGFAAAIRCNSRPVAAGQRGDALLPREPFPTAVIVRFRSLKVNDRCDEVQNLATDGC